MLNPILTISILGVLLQLIYADIECYLKHLKRMTPIDDLGALENCELSVLDEHREILKKCEIDDKVDFNDFVKFHTDVCTENTDLMIALGESYDCLQLRQLQKGCIYIDPRPAPKERLKELCRKRYDMYKCSINEHGKPCGEKALTVLFRLANTTESFLKGICYLAGGASLSNVYQFNILSCVLFTLAIWIKM